MYDVVDIQLYETDAGKCPFLAWEKRLSRLIRGRLRMCINRLRKGTFSATKSLGGGVYEIRIHDGPGYRVYFGKQKDTLVILLSGGDKGSQKRDIGKAKEYWKDYKASRKGGVTYGEY